MDGMVDESIEHTNHSSILKTDFYSMTIFDKDKQTEFYFLRIERWFLTRVDQELIYALETMITKLKIRKIAKENKN